MEEGPYYYFEGRAHAFPSALCTIEIKALAFFGLSYIVLLPRYYPSQRHFCCFQVRCQCLVLMAACSLEFDKIQTLGLAGPVAISESQSRILNMGVSGHGHILNADAPPSKDEVKENGPDRDLFEWGDSAYFSGGVSDGCRVNETLFEAMRSG